MDIHCRHCGEPWELDTLHEFGDYTRRAKLFAKFGCNALMDNGDLAEPCSMPCIDTRRGAWAVKEKFLPVVREPWGVVRGEGVAIFG
jgi:hypothetical protein